MPSSSMTNDGSDWRLFEYDMRARVAYLDQLFEAGTLEQADHDRFKATLNQLSREGDVGALVGEDMYQVIEQRLGALLGGAVGKLQAGTSRHEWLLTALRLWLIDQVEDLGESVAEVQRALLEQAEGHVAALMPGYTHLQPVQAISCAQWLLSFFWMLARDQDRMVSLVGRASISPLGSGVLAGTPFPVDREAMAHALSLTDVTANSIDAVSDWDFAAEFLFVANLLAIHLSRLAEDLTLYSNPSLGFITFEAALPEEIVGTRGAASRLFGQLAGFLSALKALPSIYNQDAANNRRVLYEAVDTLVEMLPAFASTVRDLTIQADRMWEAIDEDIFALDVIDYLAARGMAYPDAERIVRRIETHADQTGVPLSEMALEDLKKETPLFEADVFNLFDFSRSVGQHTATGGTAPSAVRTQIRLATAWLVDADFG